jgi:hypothetical protein
MSGIHPLDAPSFVVEVSFHIFRADVWNSFFDAPSLVVCIIKVVYSKFILC